MKHALKTWPEYFQAVSERGKCFEVRKNDRPFKVGDTLLLQEWNPETKEYTGDYIERVITYILVGGKFGILEGFVVMGIKEKYY